MAENSYSKAFDDAVAETRTLLVKRVRINERLLELRDTIRALGRNLKRDSKRREALMKVLNEMSVFAPRLTDAVKDALYFAFDPRQSRHRKLPAHQVKLLMEVRGFDFSGFPNPLASIHSTLKRLTRQGDIGSEVDRGMAVYFWNGPIIHSAESMLAIDAAQRPQMDRKIRESIDQRLATRYQG